MSSKDILIKTDNVLVREMDLGPGGSTEWHYHSRVLDHIVCLTGQIRVEIKGGTSTDLRPGRRTRVLQSTVHRVVNLGSFPSTYLLIQGVGPYDFLTEGSIEHT